MKNENTDFETTEIIFSEMTEADLEQVSRIEKEIFTTPWTKQGFAEALSQDYCLFMVAKTPEGEVAGYCGLYQSGDEADITNVAVAEKYRCKKIAERMLAELMKAGNMHGIKDYTLEVRCSNLAAINLYKKSGFESVGVRKNFYRNPVEDAEIMWLYGDVNG